MKKLSKAGIKGFILDLRFNPGGLLDSAVKISDLFIEDGLIVSHPPAQRSGDLLRRQGGRQLRRLPDGVPGQRRQRQRQRNRLGLPAGSSTGPSSSARAATARAACRRCTTPFDTGFLANGKTPGILKLTTATFWRPTGKNLNKASTKGRDTDEWGVTPNPGFLLKLGNKEAGRFASPSARSGDNTRADQQPDASQDRVPRSPAGHGRRLSAQSDQGRRQGQRPQVGSWQNVLMTSDETSFVALFF